MASLRIQAAGHRRRRRRGRGRALAGQGGRHDPRGPAHGRGDDRQGDGGDPLAAGRASARSGCTPRARSARWARCWSPSTRQASHGEPGARSSRQARPRSQRRRRPRPSQAAATRPGRTPAARRRRTPEAQASTRDGTRVGDRVASAPPCWPPRPRASWRASWASTSARVNGTGPRRRITSEDVRAHRPAAGSNGGAAATGPGAGRSSHRPACRPPTCAFPSGACAARSPSDMVRSQRKAAHFTYVEEVDCTAAGGSPRKGQRPPGPPRGAEALLPAVHRAATVEALRRFPQMNAYLDEAAGEIVQRAPVPHRAGHRHRRRPDRAGGPRRGPQVAGRAGARHRSPGRS